MLRLFTGDIVSPVLALALMPFVLRIYSPADFGVFQFYMTFAMILSPICNFSMGHAVLQQKNESDFINILSCLFNLLLIGSVFSTLFLLLYVIIFNVSYFSLSHLFLFFIIMISTGFAYISKYVMFYFKDYGSVAKLSILNSFTNNVLKIFLGSFHSNITSLMISLLVANFISAAFVLASNLKFIVSTLRLVSFKKLLLLLRQQKNFSLYMTGSQILSIFINWHLILIAPLFTNAHELGVFSLAHVTVNTPMYPFIDSISNYLFNEQASLNRISDKLFYKMILLGFIIAIFIVIMMFYLGEFLYGFLFGDRWIDSYKFALVLIVPIAFSFVLLPFYRGVASLQRAQNLMVRVDLFLLLILLFLMSFLYSMEYEFITAVYVSSLMISIGHIIKFVLAWRVVCKVF